MEKTVVAICYDFDKTLAINDMQAFSFIPNLGLTTSEFWAKCGQFSKTTGTDSILSYLRVMMDECKEKNIPLTRAYLNSLGKDIKYFDGVTTWFKRLNAYAEERGIQLEHYIISSGLREMIEGTEIAGEFEKIYASSFFYDDDGVAVWPAQVVNFTNKTQFLFRISKGVLGINDDGVNDYFAPDEMRVPFRNMVYIGDSDTDIPCMKLVNSYGGHSIGVYDPDTENKARVQKMMRENRIRYYAPADYTEGSELDRLLQMVLDKTAAAEKLEDIYFEKNRESGSGAE
jgi:2-hydroxy-3-keto-5-methylthiopentenyl-1-phosphate phosphatase